MSGEANSLRSTFDEVALLYDRVRPGYPPQLFDDVVAYSAIPSDGTILEIGCGTGQATVPLAQRGYRILAIELGANLAAVARRNLVAYPHVEVHIGAFEEAILSEHSFDLAISATAFHWITPAIGYPKIAHALRPHGTVALFWNKHVYSERSEEFFAGIQEIYLREAPLLTRKDWALPRAEEATEPTIAHMERSGLFSPTTLLRYEWDEVYDAESYICVLNTYSDHRNLDPVERERLFAGIRDLIETRFDGQIAKRYLTLLAMAKPRW